LPFIIKIFSFGRRVFAFRWFCRTDSRKSRFASNFCFAALVSGFAWSILLEAVVVGRSMMKVMSGTGRPRCLSMRDCVSIPWAVW